MSAPNPNQPRAGVASTPSTPFGGTQTNDAFNALVRAAETGYTAPVEVTDPLLTVIHSLRNVVTSPLLRSLAAEAVVVDLREAGFSL